MRFSLFSKVSFTVTDPIALIESYCIQSNFYANYDSVPIEKRQVNKIGARIKENLLPKCKAIVEKTKGLELFKFSSRPPEGLDKFLNPDLTSDADKRRYIEEFNENAVKGLLGYGIGLSKVAKVFHTFYPEIVPIIDNPLQKLYRKEINSEWRAGKPEIFVDYYDNLQGYGNLENVNEIFKELSKRNLTLTKLRIFDVLWWSYLKAKKLGEKQKITWNLIRW